MVVFEVVENCSRVLLQNLGLKMPHFNCSTKKGAVEKTTPIYILSIENYQLSIILVLVTATIGLVATHIASWVRKHCYPVHGVRGY